MSIQTITSVPPIDFLSVGQPLNVWSISGNSQQNGTPTPTAPIYPEFVGERTENLFHYAASWDGESAYSVSYTAVGESAIRVAGQANTGKQITVSVAIPDGTYSARIVISGTLNSSESHSFNFTVNGTRKALSFDKDHLDVTQNFTGAISNVYTMINAGFDGDITISIMLNTGSTAKPYEPYGYKLPITISEQTTPVYFGQTQTTRRIKKLVLTGEEEWSYDAQYTRFYITAANFVSLGLRITPFISNAFISVHDGRQVENIPDNSIYSGAGGYSTIYIKCSDFASLDAWKSWLAGQYESGDPIIIWYILGNEETSIINEPLCKIGDYVDTVSDANTGAPNIPTSEGSNILTIGTTLQPSEVSITYMAPNTIAENLQRLQIARTNIATAITTKGGTLVENAGFEDFPDAINNIPIESGGMPMAGITILLYDGSTFGDAGPTTIIEEGSI